VNINQYTRRQALQDTLKLFGAGAATWIASGIARASELPIKTSGLEHIGMQVPDQEAAAKFYGRIFDPQLFQEKDPPPRFYAKIGISYIAFGGLPAGVTAPRIDHFCAVGLDYKGQEMRKSLDEAGACGCNSWARPRDCPGRLFPLRGFHRTSRRYRPLGSSTSCWR
jgi:catechol 2,3-dioxygenase-like lactoylglutathione lyase family enzyme